MDLLVKVKKQYPFGPCGANANFTNYANWLTLSLTAFELTEFYELLHPRSRCTRYTNWLTQHF